MSIIDRLHHRPSQNEKKRNSAGDESRRTSDLGGIQEEPEQDDEDEGEHDRDKQGPREIFFNKPLPPTALDEEGHPIKHYRRNKIRTAKYTPISFIPKNLWYQFHNIANVYFLLLIILAVSQHLAYLSGPTNLLEVLPYIRRIKSRFERCTTDCHRCHHCNQGRHRRLPPDSPG